MKFTKEFLNSEYEKIKRIGDNYFLKNNYRTALNVYSFAAKFMYSINLRYYDDDIEEKIKVIAQNICVTEKIEYANDGVVVFYDSYGYDLRGIANIYLKSLVKQNRRILYITTIKAKGNIPTVLKILSKTEGNEIRYIDNSDYVKEAKQILELVKNETVSMLFLYLLPWDLAGIMVGNALEGKIERIMINLVDHGFWIGKQCFDKLLEFREYGVKIALQKRKISGNKVFYLPYYPNIEKNIEFKGWGIDVGEKQIVFSGGSLYKTFGDNNKYYDIVKKILLLKEDVVFIYAGTGNTSELEKLQKEFPDRVHYFGERADLYQMMKHCTIYLSTYPMIGGLMSQYAAAAHKPPYTLLFDEGSSGVLLDAQKAQVEYEDENEMLDAISRVLNSSEDRELVYAKMQNQILTEYEFDEALERVIVNGEKVFEVHNCKNVETEKFQNTYIQRLSYKNYFKLFGKKDRRYWVIARYFPIKFLCGCLCGISERIWR